MDEKILGDNRFCKLFSEGSTSVPAVLPFALLLRIARELTAKPHCTLDFVSSARKSIQQELSPDSRFDPIEF